MKWTEHQKKFTPHIRYRNAAGKIIPGVTTILSGLGWSTQTLINWATRLALEGQDPEQVKQESARIGTAAHYLIECWLKKEPPQHGNFTPNQLHFAQQACQNFVNWAGTKNIRWYASEQVLISESWQYGGTADILLYIDDVFCLADFKTSANIYESHKIQLAAYALAWNEIHPEQPVQQIWAMRIGRELGDFHPHQVQYREWAIAQELFLLLRQVHGFKGKL